jgi:type I restriction enzyme M protein
MGYVFEELIRKFNEENNEEAGEHFTPREVIELMTISSSMPMKEAAAGDHHLRPACGSGGMLTEAQNFIARPRGQIRSQGRGYALRQGDQRRDLRHLQVGHDDQGQRP